MLTTSAFAQAVPDAATATSTSGAGAVAGALNNNSTTNGAQTTNVAPVSNGDSTSAANSGSTAIQGQSLVNGGSSANNGGVFAPTNSNSTSDSASVSGSISKSQGGNSNSDAHATGGNATGGNSTASSTANPNANNAGNAQNITFNSTAPSHSRVETVPQVYAPALSTTLTETCMGSTSGGISVMGFGGTLGTTWNDAQCVRRLNAREMAQTLGDRDAARALMCQDKDVAAAYAAVGEDCRMKWSVPVPVAQSAPPPPVVINNNIPPAPPAVMAPIPNPPSIDYLLAPKPHHRSAPKPAASCHPAATSCPSKG